MQKHNQFINLFKIDILKKFNNLSYSTAASVSELYDLVVIGGGSGGLACAKEAASYGKRVAVLDYVDPSLRGSTWGLGGTCVNVGCIPKKLMHSAALHRMDSVRSQRFGWTPVDMTHNWDTLRSNVNDYIKSLNWKHRMTLREKDVKYLNAKGYVVDKNTVKATFPNTDRIELLKTENIVIATGKRPKYLDIKGCKEFCISSDDIFNKQTPPGKVLCIGASYVSLECAGFLNGLGYDTTVIVRSRPLRQFDEQMSKLVTEAMIRHGVRFLDKSEPTSIVKQGDRLKVNYSKNGANNLSDIFDTVIIAIGRQATTDKMGLKEVGVALEEDGTIIGNHDGEFERTSVPNIYAIGDVLTNGIELTPVAIKAGKLLAQRLCRISSDQMDYNLVPTAVFTPLEYAFVGMSEEEAEMNYGDSNIEIYHAYFQPLEFSLQNQSDAPDPDAPSCYFKVIVEVGSNKVLGIHYVGPNAGEVIQGYAVAMRCKLTIKELQSTVGIHPTCAEEIVKLRITKKKKVPTATLR